MKNKILFFITSDFPHGTGEQFIENEIDCLIDAYDKVLIINQIYHFGSSRKKHKKIEVISSWKGRIYKLFFSSIAFFIFIKPLLIELRRIPFRLGSFLKVISWTVNAGLIYFTLKNLYSKNKGKNSIVIYSYWGSPAAVAAAKMKTDYNSIISLNRLHGYDIYEERSPDKYLPYREFIYKNNYQFLICNSAKSYLLKKYRYLKENNIVVSRLGTKKISNFKVISNDCDFKIVSCSYLVPIKRVDIIAKSMILLSKKMPDKKISWCHMGDGPLRVDIDSILFEKPENLTVILMGQISNLGVVEHYKKHGYDIFINLSKSEGVPVSMMEAQSAFIPIMATNVGGVSEIVNDDNGWLIQDEIARPEVVSQKLCDIVKNENCKEILLSKAEKSHLNWLENYNAEKNYPDFLEKIEKLRGLV